MSSNLLTKLAFVRANSASENNKSNLETTNDYSFSGTDFTRVLFESPKNVPKHTEPNDHLLKITNHLNSILVNLGLGKLGDIFSNDEEEMHRTVDVIYQLVDQKIKDMEFKKEAHEKLSKMEHDNSLLLQSLKKIKIENKFLKNTVESLRSSMSQIEKLNNFEKSKLVNEKDQLKQNLALFNQKIVQYQEELNKKEEAHQKFKEQMLKKRLQIIEGLHAEVISSEGSQPFILKLPETTLSSGFDNSHPNQQKVLDENQVLRTILKETHNDLAKIKNKSKAMTEENLKDETNPGMFEMPINIFAPFILKNIKENIQTLSQNVQSLFDNDNSFIREGEGTFQKPSSFIKIYRSNTPKASLLLPDRNNTSSKLEENRAGIRSHRRIQSSFSNRILINTSAEQSFIIPTPSQNSPPKLNKKQFSLPHETILDSLNEEIDNRTNLLNHRADSQRKKSLSKWNLPHLHNDSIPSESFGS